MTRLLRTAGMIAALSCLQTAAVSAQPVTETREAVLVQGSSLRAAIAAVCAVGGDVTHELGIINAVGATLTCARLETDVAETDAAR